MLILIANIIAQCKWQYNQFIKASNLEHHRRPGWTPWKPRHWVFPKDNDLMMKTMIWCHDDEITWQQWSVSTKSCTQSFPSRAPPSWAQKNISNIKPEEWRRMLEEAAEYARLRNIYSTKFSEMKYQKHKFNTTFRPALRDDFSKLPFPLPLGLSHHLGNLNQNTVNYTVAVLSV